MFGPGSWAERHPSLYLYSIHAVEPLFTVMGPGCETVQRIKTEDVDIVIGTLPRGDYVVEKIHFQSLLGAYVIGNLYRPANIEKPLPAVLSVREFVSFASTDGKAGAQIRCWHSW